MSAILRLTVLSLLISCLLSSIAFAQWPTDPAVNLPLGDGTGEQVVPHLSVNADNSCYTGWYNSQSGNYDVALQLVDASGTEMWPHGGIIVSDHAQNTWVMDWDLLSDSAGNAIVAFADIRDGNSNIHVYKISPAGDFLWGADGIDITNNNDGKGPPSLVETNDGDIVVAWFADSTFMPNAIRIQRLAADGTLRYGANGIVTTETSDSLPTGQRMVPSGEDGFIMGYVPNYSFMDNREIKAQRFNAAGQSTWLNYLMIMENSTIPMGHYFEMMSDGNDGAFFSWSVATGLNFSVRTQHVNDIGAESFVHNGLPVSTESSFSQISPDMAHDLVTGDLTVLFIQMTSNQTEKGIFGQRLSPTGDLLWGTTGLEILPVDSSREGFVRVLDTGDGVIGLCFQAPYNSYGEDNIIGFKLDTDGGFVWDPSLVDVSTLPSAKDDLVVVMGSDGTSRAIWSDQRNGNADIFGQNLNDDGSIGLSLVLVPDTVQSMIRLNQNYPNPFNPSTEISFSLPDRQHTVLQVADTRGHIVRTLLDAETGPGSRTIRWDGRNNNGTKVPSGMYFYRLESGDTRQVRKMVMIK